MVGMASHARNQFQVILAYRSLLANRKRHSTNTIVDAGVGTKHVLETHERFEMIQWGSSGDRSGPEDRAVIRVWAAKEYPVSNRKDAGSSPAPTLSNADAPGTGL